MFLLPFFDKSLPNWAIEARLLRWLTFIWLFIGLAVLFSASYSQADISFNDPFHFFKLQVIWALIGLVFFNVIVHLRLAVIFRWANLGFVVGLAALMFTHISGIGATAGGASRWLDFGGIGLQPSELIKPFLILKAAQVFSQWQHLKLLNKVVWLGLFGLMLGGILVQPNLSMTVLCGMMLWIVAWAADLPAKYLLITMVGGGALGLISITLQDYQRRRIVSFLNPWLSHSGDGYQLTQSLMAIGSGSLWGTGFGLSNQKLYLPFQYTDFIFAVFAEEFGFVGSVALILMLLVYALLGGMVAVKAQNATVSLVAVGSTFLLVGQSFINIAVAAGGVPTTGLPFPFMTYGGSSMISSLLIAGLLIRCGREMSQVILFPVFDRRKKSSSPLP